MARRVEGGEVMTVYVRTGSGFVTSFRSAWPAPDGSGRSVWTWRIDGAEPHDFGTVEAAERWIDEVFHGESQKQRDEADWTVVAS
jgi:hypothetical protein